VLHPRFIQLRRAIWLLFIFRRECFEWAAVRADVCTAPSRIICYQAMRAAGSKLRTALAQSHVRVMRNDLSPTGRCPEHFYPRLSQRVFAVVEVCKHRELGENQSGEIIGAKKHPSLK
jgi:hypothetical protein